MSKLQAIVYFITSTESGSFRYALKFHVWGGAERVEFDVRGGAEYVKVWITYEAKPNTGIIGASAG
jgi:hypothetical protein